MRKDLPSPEFLRKLLHYEAESGNLFWKYRTPDVFTDGKYGADRKCRTWNAKYAGMQAFTAINGCGYMVGAIFDKKYQAHRVIWAMVHGEWPHEQIDHINGVRRDNRIKNLRSVSQAENLRNQKRHSSNTSGVCGVVWDKLHSRWRAQIAYGGKNIYLGLFSDFDEAVAARKAAEIEHGFHQNHGRS